MEYKDDLTLYRALINGSKGVENNPAIYYFNNKISFAKFIALVDRWASILQNDLNVERGDSVIISLPNIPQTLILFYAVNKVGGIANMVHPKTPCNKMQEYYDESKSKVAFLFDRSVYAELSGYKKFVGNIVLCDIQTYFFSKSVRKIFDISYHSMKTALKTNTHFTFYRKYKDNVEETKEIVLSPNETSVLLHSASTTGDSKTIMLSAKSFNYSASKATDMLCIDSTQMINKTMISLLPSFHGFGLGMTMHLPLANSFAVTLIPKYKPTTLTRIMTIHKNVICICGVPIIYKTLIRDNSFIKNRHLKTLVACFSGGDSLPSSVKEAFDSLMSRVGSTCRLYEGYGLTEALSVSCVNTLRHHKYGSVGYPIDGVSFKIVDEQNDEVPANIVGEICIKSKINMLGYYKDPESTKKAYVDGYLKTGDIGYMDEDGFIYYKSRIKRVIKVSGVAVFPSEVEQVISHIPGVKGVCAVQIPDEKMTNAVKVFVKANFNDENIIKDECKKHLMIWAVPKEVEFVSKLPYTKYKKVNFQKLQKEQDDRIK